MNKKSDFIISERFLFPEIKKMLEEGKSVSFTVSGNSMWPLIIHNRDSVILSSCDNQHLKKGDIILFHAGAGHHVLHRITSVKLGGYITTGDGNLHRDGFVSVEDVIAKVEKIYRKDKVIDCDKWYWKLIFRIWMIMFPIRGFLQRVILFIKRYV